MADSGTKMRRGLLLHTLFEILRDSVAPLANKEVMERIEDRIDLNERELSLNTSGGPRWTTTVNFVSSWAVGIGWLTKDPGWAITEAGREAVDTYTPDDLYQEISRRNSERRGAQTLDIEVQQDGWEAFLHWGQRLADSVDLEVEERDYKLQLAKRLQSVRELALAADSEWLDEFKRTLASTNLLNRFFLIAFFDELKSQPEKVREVLVSFWSGEPEPEHLDDFLLAVRSLSNHSAYSPGNVVALGSLLLMAQSVESYPPYRPTPINMTCKLTGFAKQPGRLSPNLRYQTLLDLCDEIVDRADDAGLEVRDRLEAQGLIWAITQYDAPLDWDIEERLAFQAWRGDSPEKADDEPDQLPQQRAWLVRGSSVNGHDLCPVWIAKGSMSLAASQLRAVEAGTSREALRPIVEEDYAHASYSARQEKVDEFHAFLTKMQPEDLVATTSQGKLFIGKIYGPATYLESSDGRSNLRRTVVWLEKRGIEFELLPAEISGRLKSQRDVIDLTQQRDVLQSIIGQHTQGEPVPQIAELVLPDATKALSEELNVDEEWLQESIDLLRDRPQLIYYGPPGTGKTFIAQRLAEHLANDNVTLVQFHPSYSYEDFFEGFRPVDHGDGKLSFELKAGPLRRIVDKATEDPSTPYVLIIDEINRGNLAKIFGELYFLLEYRDKQVDLLYASGDDKGFTLPKNVFIIGTMNTADRSIAIVDAAMRRRFAFESLHPAVEPTKSILRKWLKSTSRPAENADLLDALNSQIADPDFKVGPSYFMREAVYQDGGLERAWRTAIMPLLEEHHFGDGIDVGKRYGLEAIRARLEPVTNDNLDAELAADDEHAQTP